MTNVNISEEQYNRLFLIKEDRESKNMKKARNVVRQYIPNTDPQQLITAIRNDIPNSRINDCQFLAGVTRMYIQGQIQDGETIQALNTTLKLVGNGHANEYNNDLNGMSAKDLIDRFAQVAKNDINAAMKANAQRTFQKNDNYDIVRIPNQQEAAKYAHYTDWCITTSSKMYNSYTHGCSGVFYFLLKKGFEDVYAIQGKNCPLDEYGLSMIAVSINTDGSINTCTCRWNHSHGGNDNIMNDEQISNLLGVDVYTVLKPRKIKVIKENDNFIIREVDGVRELFDKKEECILTLDDFGTATFNKNYATQAKVDANGEIMFGGKSWFSVGPFENDGCAIVQTYNIGLINLKGEDIIPYDNYNGANYISKASPLGTRYVKGIVSDGNSIEKNGFINVKLGKEVLTDKYDKVLHTEEDRCFIAVKDGIKYLFNEKLDLAINPSEYDNIDDCGEYDHCRKFEKDGKYGLFNTDFTVLLAPEYCHIGDDGMFRDAYKKNSKIYEYITDKKFRRVIKILPDGSKKRGVFLYTSMTIVWDDGEVEKLNTNAVTESISYNYNGNSNKPVINMKVNHELWDDDNMSTNNVDTRVFGYKGGMMDYNTSDYLTLKDKKFLIDVINDMYHQAIIYSQRKGRKKLKFLTDEELDSNASISNKVAGMVKKTRNVILKKIQEFTANQDFNGLTTWLEMKLNNKALSDEITMNTYNRVESHKINPFKKYANLIPRYNVGTVPNTNVKFIALFTMSDFNFSDAIKNGYIRPNTNTKAMTGLDTKNKIPVTYDNGLEANIENNFSLDSGSNNKDHYKKQYGYNDENYTSVTSFIDKSIMYAAYALNKEKYNPQFIVAAPSSSNFNDYYCNALANKLGNVQYIKDFFQRNLINFKSSDGEVIAEKMRNDGIPENLIQEFQVTMENVALGEIADIIASPMRAFLKQNIKEISNISKKHYSREKVDLDILTRKVLNYSYRTIIKTMQSQNHIEINNISKYLTDKFLNDNQGLLTQDVYLINEFRNRIKQKFGKKVFEGVIMQMYENVMVYAKQLESEQGYKLKFNKPFKIAKLSKYVRPYLTDMYVVADKNFNKNHELFSRFANGKFLIVDEDINSGATLTNVIHALQNVMPTQQTNNIMCLANAYSSGGR